MSATDWRIPQTAEDFFVTLDKRLIRQERRASAMQARDVLGPGLASEAVQIMDWNSPDTIRNGFYYSLTGAANSPNSSLTWTGQTIAKDDGTGTQQVWNTDGAVPAYWVRTYKTVFPTVSPKTLALGASSYTTENTDPDDVTARSGATGSGSLADASTSTGVWAITRRDAGELTGTGYVLVAIPEGALIDPALAMTVEVGGPDSAADSFEVVVVDADGVDYESIEVAAPAFGSPQTMLVEFPEVADYTDGTYFLRFSRGQVDATDGAHRLDVYEARLQDVAPTQGAGNPEFTAWKRFATASGYIDWSELNVPVVDTIEAAHEMATQALADAEEGMGFALASNKVFRQASAPVSDSSYTLRVGDTWFDSDDGNHIYVWSGSAWVDAQDAAIDAANAAAAQALADAQAAVDEAAQAITDADAAAAAAAAAQAAAAQALSDAGEAMDFAETRSKVYRQTTMPTEGALGDVWYDTDDGNKVYVHNGTTYVDTRDTGIAAAMTAANGKNTVFRQDAQPSTTGRVVGDTWFETDQNNRIHIWTGAAWTLSQLGTNAIADASIVNAKIVDGTIQNAKIANLDAGKVTTGTLDANRIGANSITSQKLAVIGENLVNNPGWESGLTSPHSVSNNANYATPALVTVGMFSGAYALETTVTTAFATGIQLVSTNGTAGATLHPTVKPGDVLRFEFMGYLSAGSTALLRPAIFVRSRVDPATNVYSATGSYTAATRGGYGLYSIELTVPTGATATDLYAFGTVAVNAGSVGDVVRVDSMELRRKFTGSLLVDGTITGNLISGTAIDGKTITGATVQSESTANRGVKFASTGIQAWDTLGTRTFLVDAATGVVSLLGSLTAGSAITGGIVTGGTIQTESTAARGIKITSTGLVAYNSSGVATTTITAASGQIATTGSVLTGGSVTGATVQTEATADRGVKMNSTGLFGYDSSGVAKFSLSATTGTLALSGSALINGTIDGAVITGGTIQTEATLDTGIKMNSAGLVAYHPVSHDPVFTLDTTTGNVAMLGTLTAGSSITGATISGATITGGVFRTAASGMRVEIDSADSGGFVFYTTEGDSGSLRISDAVWPFGDPGIELETPASGTAPYFARLTMASSNGPVETNYPGGPIATFDSHISVYDLAARSIETDRTGQRVTAMAHGGEGGAPNASGIVTLTHNLSLSGNYRVFVQARQNANARILTVTEKNADNFRFRVENDAGALVTSGTVGFDWWIVG